MNPSHTPNLPWWRRVIRHPAYGWTGLAMMLTSLCVLATNNLPTHLDAVRVWTANAALGGSVPHFAISHFAINRYLASKAPSRILDLIGWRAPALIAVAALASAYWPTPDAVPPDQAGFKHVLRQGPAYMSTLSVSAATAVTYLILLRIRHQTANTPRDHSPPPSDVHGSRPR